MDFPKVAMINGVFPPNTKGHAYKPMSYHGSKTHGTRGGKKTRWVIPQNGQYYIFNYGDEKEWFDYSADGLFSFCNRCEEIIGENGERLAFFKKPSNAIDPWHGYPVFSSEIEDESLLEKWLSDGEISETVYLRLLRNAI